GDPPCTAPRTLTRSRLTVSYGPTTSPIHTLSLHDALPIYPIVAPPTTTIFCRSGLSSSIWLGVSSNFSLMAGSSFIKIATSVPRSAEHTSELQSRENLVCRLLRERRN